MRNIGAKSPPRPEVGIATNDGKSYYRMTSLLNRIGLPYVDVIIDGQFSQQIAHLSSRMISKEDLKVIITTRRERLLLQDCNMVCIEDLGDDVGVAKEKLLSFLHQFRETDCFVIGIDPGERTGMVALINQLEVESSVLSSAEETVSRVALLLDNAPPVRKIVKIGAGMPRLAESIANRLESTYGRGLRIQFVDERGTSTLNSRSPNRMGTRDQRAAKLIALRQGRDYTRIGSIMS